jgi:riboflavin kinase / FMN adenylyltransferase
VSASIVTGAEKLGAAPRSTLVVIGNFDGVHLGHRAVLEASLRDAAELGLRPVALTFEPHPSKVLGRGELPALTKLERKLELLGRYHPELTIVVEPFTLELAQRTPAEFAEGLLSRSLAARRVVVGKNFRFGHNRSGGLDVLAELGASLGFEARPELLHGDASGAYSSTRIRDAIREGELALAERMLDRPHSLSGRVVPGAGRGRTIGVPTANLAEVAEALPPYGVYACLVDELTSAGARTLGTAAVNIGERPTLGAGFSVEAHLFDLSADLYGRELRLHLVARLREERRFDGLPALKAQIERDLANARQALAGRTPAAPPAWY